MGRTKQTLLFFAAARERPGALEMCRKLVEQKVDVRVKDCWGQTPLFYAASKGNARRACVI